MVLNTLKQLLGIDVADTTQDALLNFAMSNVEEIIKNYCNIDSVPEKLLNTSYRMTIDLYRHENFGHSEICQGAVKSINIGDTSTSFSDSSEDGYKDTLLKNYITQLNRFRKLVW